MKIDSELSTTDMVARVSPKGGETIKLTTSNYAFISAKVIDSDSVIFEVNDWYFNAQACDEAAAFFKLLAKITRGEATTEDLEV